MITASDMHGAILAGGAGVRMGGAKALRLLAGEPLVAHVARALRPHVSGLVVIGDAAAADAIAAEAANDPADVAKGPLAGVLAALDWAQARGARWLATAPCDAPLLPDDVFAVLRVAAEGSQLACAETDEGLEPLVAVWRVDLVDALRAALVDGRHPPVHRFLEDMKAVRVHFPDPARFMNVNTPDDLVRAEEALARRGV